MTEWTSYLFDIAQNAIRAHADTLTIHIIKADRLTLQMIDNGDGMDEKTLKQVTSPFYTTRQTRTIGLGLSLFTLLSEQTNGTHNIKSQKHQGTTLTYTFNHRHVDFPPEGDYGLLIADLTSHPSIKQLHFVYQTPQTFFQWHYKNQDRHQIIQEINQNLKQRGVS